MNASSKTAKLTYGVIVSFTVVLLLVIITLIIQTVLSGSHTADGRLLYRGLINPEKPIADFAKWVGAVLTSPLPEGALKSFLAYWIYELVKLPLLFFLTSWVMLTLRYLIPTRWLNKTIARNDFVGVLGGAILGMLTPVCSCTVTSLYAGFVAGGGSKRATAAFLFAAPAVNEFAVAVMIVATGIWGGLTYTALGLFAAVLTAYLADYLGLDPRRWHSFRPVPCTHDVEQRAPARAFHETIRLLQKLWLALVIGGTLAAILSQLNLAPLQLMRTVGEAWYGPLLATLIGLPLDINAASASAIILPLSDVLPLGTLISLMMAITLASFPEGAVLYRLAGWASTAKVAIWYLLYCTAIGLIVNALHT